MLALVAGRGTLPNLVAQAAAPDVVVCALQDQSPDTLRVDLTFRLETLGSFLLQLGQRGVTEVCFCGAIDRPQLIPERLDDETKPLVPVLMDALGKGDDGALRAVISLFETTGFNVRGAHELTPKVLLQAGTPTTRKQRPYHEDDAKLAWQAIAEMGRLDLGQACIVRKGKVLAREDESGTDSMLAANALAWVDHPGLWRDNTDELTVEAVAWCQRLRAENHHAPGAGSVLCKAPKPDQDRRADLPTIGSDTAVSAALAGCDGIVIQEQSVIVLEAARVVALLDAMDMFLWVRAP